MSDRKKVYLVLAWGIVMMCVAILGAWLKFDYRAAIIAFCSFMIGMATEMCVEHLDDLKEMEDCELHVFKCKKCGEVIKYRIISDSSDERKDACALIHRCPMCGGELAEMPEDYEDEASDYVQ